MINDYLLSEFEAWCRGEGRGGPGAGMHASALQRIDDFRRFKRRQAEQVKPLTKKQKIALPD